MASEVLKFPTQFLQNSGHLNVRSFVLMASEVFRFGIQIFEVAQRMFVVLLDGLGSVTKILSYVRKLIHNFF